MATTKIKGALLNQLGKKCEFCDNTLDIMDPPVCEECLGNLKKVVKSQAAKEVEPVIMFKTAMSFPRRLWFFITNPFTYIFKGKIRY